MQFLNISSLERDRMLGMYALFGEWYELQDISSHSRDPHYIEQTVSRPPYICNGNPYTYIWIPIIKLRRPRPSDLNRRNRYTSKYCLYIVILKFTIKHYKWLRLNRAGALLSRPDRGSFSQGIKVTSHGRLGVWNHWQLDHLFSSLFGMTTKETLKI